MNLFTGLRELRRHADKHEAMAIALMAAINAAALRCPAAAATALVGMGRNRARLVCGSPRDGG